jgi:hypothetical protein
MSVELSALAFSLLFRFQGAVALALTTLGVGAVVTVRISAHRSERRRYPCREGTSTSRGGNLQEMVSFLAPGQEEEPVVEGQEVADLGRCVE